MAKTIKKARAKVVITLELDVFDDPDFEYDIEIAAKTAMNAAKDGCKKRNAKAISVSAEWSSKITFKGDR